MEWIDGARRIKPAGIVRTDYRYLYNSTEACEQRRLVTNLERLLKLHMASFIQ